MGNTRVDVQKENLADEDSAPMQHPCASGIPMLNTRSWWAVTSIIHPLLCTAKGVTVWQPLGNLQYSIYDMTRGTVWDS